MLHILKYGSVIWCLYNKSVMQHVEFVQRRTTKFIVNSINVDYALILKFFNILPFSLQREYLVASFSDKCIKNKVDINIFNYVEMCENLIDTQLHDDNVVILKVQRIKQECYPLFFLEL